MPATSIGDAIRRARDYLRLRPEEARYTDTPAIATIEDGFRCRVTGPSGAVLVSDMSTGVGGTASAPSPGWLLRAAHAACDATLIAMRAAEEGVELSRLEVAVDSESDDRGMLGMDEAAPPGPLTTRVQVTIAAPAVSDEQLRRIVSWARDHSPVDDALGRVVPIETVIDVARARGRPPPRASGPVASGGADPTSAPGSGRDRSSARRAW